MPDSPHRETIEYVTTPCMLETMLVARSARGLCAIILADEAQEAYASLQDRFPHAVLAAGDERLQKDAATIAHYADHGGALPALTLDIRGTAFQQAVWRALQAIPAGQTASYTAIAAMIGRPQAVRAVAGACAANALAVIIPCHRIVRQDGQISGYRWGVSRKKKLLAREGAFPAQTSAKAQRAAQAHAA